MAEDVNYYPEDSEPREASDNDDGGSGLEEGGVQTALIPKSMLMGYECNPGDKIVMEVKHLYEDEVEVEFVKKDKSKEKAPDSDMNQDEQLDSMAMEPDASMSTMA